MRTSIFIVLFFISKLCFTQPLDTILILKPGIFNKIDTMKNLSEIRKGKLHVVSEIDSMNSLIVKIKIYDTKNNLIQEGKYQLYSVDTTYSFREYKTELTAKRPKNKRLLFLRSGYWYYYKGNNIKEYYYFEGKKIIQ